MRDIDELAVRAAEDEHLLEELILGQKRFLMNCASGTAKRYITESDDEWSVTLSAFLNAVKTYSYERGSFLSYARIAITHNLIDYYRAERRRSPEHPVDPALFETGPGEDGEDLPIRRELAVKLAVARETSVRDEIEAAAAELSSFGFAFYDIAASSPKSAKTKEACRKAVRCILDSGDILDEVVKTKQLPIKIIQKSTGLPRKILERHRRYIIAAMVILSGEYPHLAEYVSNIGKKSDQ